ncbi:MAG: lactate utilization protein [Segetibacter sp.]|nr:lactate utilization protein [Segetibacter sp.]
MSSREKILADIKRNKPAEVAIPSFEFTATTYDNVVTKYMETLLGIGGNCNVVKDLTEVNKILSTLVKDQEVVIGISELGGYNASEYAFKDAAALEGVDTVVIEGNYAVAENASIWIPEKNMVNRMLPFICQHLIIVVNESDVVSNMHEAYARIKVDEDGYGAFIAGPFKTADIEQSLVIGAHGPLSLNVFIISADK